MDRRPRDQFDLSGHNWGWGVSISSNVKATSSDVFRLQYVPKREHRQQRSPVACRFHKGQYALGNLLWTPVTNVMIGGEYQWSRRENFSDGFDVGDHRLQFSFKYSFSAKITGE